MNCTDSSKHDAISASYCYSLNPNTIRHSNTTIMRGARLTLSSTPSCLRCRFTIIFVKIWADKERNVRKQGGLYFNFSFLFLNANIRQCLYPVTPPYYVLMNLFLITRLLLRKKKKGSNLQLWAVAFDTRRWLLMLSPAALLAASERPPVHCSNLP